MRTKQVNFFVGAPDTPLSQSTNQHSQSASRSDVNTFECAQHYVSMTHSIHYDVYTKWSTSISQAIND